MCVCCVFENAVFIRFKLTIVVGAVCNASQIWLAAMGSCVREVWLDSVRFVHIINYEKHCTVQRVNTSEALDSLRFCSVIEGDLVVDSLLMEDDSNADLAWRAFSNIKLITGKCAVARDFCLLCLVFLFCFFLVSFLCFQTQVHRTMILINILLLLLFHPPPLLPQYRFFDSSKHLNELAGLFRKGRIGSHAYGYYK